MDKLMNIQKVRVDKFLWAIRLFKTRALAVECLNKGRITCNENKLKPSYQVKIGDVIHIKLQNQQIKIIEVIALLDKRQSAEKVKPFFIDHSPPPQLNEDQLPSVFYEPSVKREKGTGRPTKKDRRKINDYFKD